jgi:hypothetical protein
MSSTPTEQAGWRQGRWWFWLAMVFLAQLGLILGLSDRSPLLVRPSPAGPRIDLAANASPELLALHDPTLLALPHPQGFSGPAWLKVQPQEFHSVDWDEPTNWLALPVAELGTSLRQSLGSNRLATLDWPAMPHPELTVPEVRPTLVFPQKSGLRIEGELAQRPMTQGLELRSWPLRTNSAGEASFLTNTILQMVVDAMGKPVSVTVLTRSGLPQADDEAVKQARSARFEPLAHNAPIGTSNALVSLNWGRLVFEWHTDSSPVP